ncbi:MAG TPA: hypothetical protein VGC57_13435 [Cellulomonas sp.]
MSARLRARLRAGANGEAGFTIVESVVAMVVLVLMSTSVLASVVATIRLADQVRSRTVATELATREIAAVRQVVEVDPTGAQALLTESGTLTNQTPLEGGSAGDPIVMGGTAYTVTHEVELVSTAGQSICSAGGTSASGVDQLVLQIAATVTWDTRGTFAPIRVVERVPLPSLPAQTGGADYAVVAVQVKDPTAAKGSAGVAGATVTLSGSTKYGSLPTTPITATTDSDGCAVLRVQGSTNSDRLLFTAQVTKDGYVSEAWATSVGAQLGVLDYYGAVNRIEVRYAPAATIRVHVTNADGTGAATDAEVAGMSLTLVCSTEGTAASDPGYTVEDLTSATVEVTPVWPCQYSAYVNPAGESGVPDVLSQIPVIGAATVDIWVRPGYGIVAAPQGEVAPSPEPSDESTEGAEDPAVQDPATEGPSEGEPTGDDSDPATGEQGEDGSTGENPADPAPAPSSVAGGAG